MTDINFSAIDGAISDAARLAEFYYNNTHGPGSYDNYQGYRRTAEEAKAAMSRLYALLPEFRAYQANKSAEYDRYVTRYREPSSEGCSCHISPPCSYCTREADEDEPASVDGSAERQDAAGGLIGEADDSAVPATPGDAQPHPHPSN